MIHPELTIGSARALLGLCVALALSGCLSGDPGSGSCFHTPTEAGVRIEFPGHLSLPEAQEALDEDGWSTSIWGEAVVIGYKVTADNTTLRAILSEVRTAGPEMTRLVIDATNRLVNDTNEAKPALDPHIEGIIRILNDRLGPPGPRSYSGGLWTLCGEI